MPSRYFFTSLAARPMTLSGRVFRFDVFNLSAGRASGVYEASATEEIAILEDAVRGRRGVSEMSAEEGAEAKKKAALMRQRGSSTDSRPRVVQPPILPQLAVEAKAGVPFAGKPSGTTPSENLLSGPSPTRPSIVDLLRLGKVNPPKPFAASEAKVRKASARADRAKIRVARPSE